MPEPLVFPRVEQGPTILSFPHEEPAKPQLDPFPAERPREMGDNILWSNTVYDISKLNNTGNFTSGALEHILEGELNARGRAVGFHYEGMPTTKGNIIPGTESLPNQFGVYTARVEVNGVPKTGNGGTSTLFPKSYTPQDVVDSINESYNSRQFIQGTRNTFRGQTSSGVIIEMYIDSSTGKIISAFPKY